MSSLFRHRRFIALPVLVLMLTPGCLFAEQPPIIAAASDLQFALTEIAERFTHRTGQTVCLSFGSSGNFRRQIAQGGPFQMFLSADENYVLALHRQGFTRDAGDLYAIGRVAIVVPPGSALQPDGYLEGLAQALETGKISRFAIANPEHAPYGVAAKEALQTAG